MIEELKERLGNYISEDKTMLKEIDRGELGIPKYYIKGRKDAYEKVLEEIKEITNEEKEKNG